MGRKVLVACDDTPHSRVMVDVAFQQAVHRTTDEIHLATVLPPPALAQTYPMAPMASGAAVVAVHQSAQAQRQIDLERAKETLRLVADLIAIDYKVPRDNIHMHVLPCEGGASNVSEALIRLAKDKEVDLMIVGNRGLGAIKRSLMSLVGLGSVSDAVLRNAPCPVLLIRWDTTKPHGPHVEAEPPPIAAIPKRVLVGIDETPLASSALYWALDNVLSAHDQLHVVSVAVAPPYPVLDEPAAVAAMQAQAAADSRAAAEAAARQLVEDAVEAAVSRGVIRTKIVPVVLTPAGGMSDVGAAITQYANEKQVEVVVVGSRGLGAVQASLMSFIGLGSVSQHLAHTLHCALAVVKHIHRADDGNNPVENLAFHVIPEEAELKT